MIRVATVEDAVALAAIQHRAWWRAYAEYVDPGRFGALDERVTRWRELLVQPPQLRRITLVHEIAGRPAGFASVGPARDDDLGDGVGELMAIYVDPPAQGAGVGGGLLSAAEGRLRAGDYRAAVLWVFERNEHARHVYEQRGWVLEGGDVIEPEREGGGWAPAVRYRLEL